ncbi:MAG: chemotaxis protein CheW [Spirochaetales bacterium]|nr:chemotaxis protein CheW [Spirochaetales bacterium]
METTKQIREELVLIYTIDGLSFGLPLSSVERIVRSVTVTPLPDAPNTILGVIIVQGRIIPVVNMRLKLRLRSRAVSIKDKFIIAGTGNLMVVLVADEVEGVVKRPLEKVATGEEADAWMKSLEGIVKLDDVPVPIHNLDCFLSEEAVSYSDAD